MRLLHRDRTDHDTVDLRDGAEHEVDDRGDADRRPDDRTETMAQHDREVAVADRETTPARIRERQWTFAPGQTISLLTGGAIAAVGAVALARAGVGRPLDSPVVEVLDLDHTAWLGLGELALGLVLVLIGTGAWGRPLSVLLGAAMVVGGVVVVTEADALPEELALETDHGWPLMALGALVAIAAIALPVWRTQTTNVRTVDLRRHEVDRDHPRRRFWSRR